MKFASLKNGEILSETQFYRVEKVKGNQAQLLNEQGESIVVDDKYVDTCLISGTQYSREEKLTRTELIAKFLASANVALTVNFNTKVKEADVVAEVMAKINGASFKDVEKAVKAGVKKALEGEERTMKGRHFGEMNEHGRIQFIDMEETRDNSKSYDNRLRQVDPRTINYVILKDVKYVVK